MALIGVFDCPHVDNHDDDPWIGGWMQDGGDRRSVERQLEGCLYFRNPVNLLPFFFRDLHNPGTAG